MNISNQYTPGPWEAQWSTGSNGDLNGWHVFNRSQPEEPLICEIPDGRLDKSEGANACLIAAAPDLLEALKWLLEQCQEADFEISLFGYENCLRAISKAEGQTDLTWP